MSPKHKNTLGDHYVRFFGNEDVSSEILCNREERKSIHENCKGSYEKDTLTILDLSMPMLASKYSRTPPSYKA